ncbi:hypothetical protein [Naasia sp. SYSU D00057]|uniref:hypothetical protein n=1 Tax=Naasia sp. SYSU D00057 TaxID=2817380 RepID=UPI001B30A853|nr:hypothetical protein [Naasia sp. SYSU D00057]
MALRRIPGRNESYHLIAFDKHGHELPDPDGGTASASALAALAEPGVPVTDVFVLSHGWQSDHGDAIAQYDAWLGAANPDRAGDGIRPLVIGLHWPSKAWSDGDLAAAPSGLLGDPGPGGAGTVTVDEAVDAFAATLADTPEARAALAVILDHAASVDPEQDAGAGDTLPPEVVEAYRMLAAQAEVSAGDDPLLGDGWDPELAFAEAAEHGGEGDDGLLGDGFWGKLREAVLTPLRQLTFWSMKDRARKFGEGAGRRLLQEVQEAAPGARVHLVGHSFGTIVVAGTVRGPGATPRPPVRPVQSLFLVQGALSLWAFSADVPRSVGGGRGYFADLADPRYVSGPIVATRSRWDYAVGRFYPLAVRGARQYLLGELPKYGGVGAFGIQGAGAKELDPLAEGALPKRGLAHGFYNVDASKVIATLAGPAGAHSDIAHPELTWLAWEAAGVRG